MAQGISVAQKPRKELKRKKHPIGCGQFLRRFNLDHS